MTYLHRPRAATRAVVLTAAIAALSLIVPRAFAAPASPTITSPSAGGVVSGLSPVTIRGGATEGATVQVFDGVTSRGTTTAGANGWSLSASLADGEHTITATASDGTGASAPSAPVTFTVDGVRPSVAIAYPEADHVFAAGEAPVVTGTASDDRGLYAIRLEYWALGSMKQARLAECDGCDGSTGATWHHDPNLEPGDWLVKAFSVDKAGNYSLQSTRRFVNADAGAPFAGPELPGVGLPEVVPPEILTPDEGSTEPGAAEPIEFGGTTEPGSRVQLYEEFQGLGKIGAAADDDEDGRWQISVRLPTGTYAVQAKARDADGNTSELSELIVFTVDGERPTIDLLTQQNRVFLPTERVVLEGTVADNFEAAWVILEYYDLEGKLKLRDAATCACPAKGATWTHRPTLPWGPGRYTVKVWAFDVAGNPSHQKTISIVKSI